MRGWHVCVGNVWVKRTGRSLTEVARSSCDRLVCSKAKLQPSCDYRPPPVAQLVRKHANYARLRHPPNRNRGSLWSASAERSGDGALASPFKRGRVDVSSLALPIKSGVALRLPPHPKRGFRLEDMLRPLQTGIPAVQSPGPRQERGGGWRWNRQPASTAAVGPLTGGRGRLRNSRSRLKRPKTPASAPRLESTPHSVSGAQSSPYSPAAFAPTADPTSRWPGSSTGGRPRFRLEIPPAIRG